jgi:hypothetical protein
METKINLGLAICFAVMALTCMVGAAFCGAWWHLYTFLLCAGMTWTLLTARDDGGDSAWERIKRIVHELHEFTRIL